MKSLIFAILFGLTAFALAEDLPPGHPTISDALQEAGKSVDDPAATLPNQGTVVSTVDSRGYTYIEVEQEGKQVWLAAPKVELAAGSVIRYGQGITMANFYSNGLKREFAEIFFVDRVESVK
jgi:hypothetical protein